MSEMLIALVFDNQQIYRLFEILLKDRLKLISCAAENCHPLYQHSFFVNLTAPVCVGYQVSNGLLILNRAQCYSIR